MLLIWSESNFLTVFGFSAIGLLGSMAILIPHSDNLSGILNDVLKNKKNGK